MDVVRIQWTWGTSFGYFKPDACDTQSEADCCGNGILDDGEECDNGSNEYGSGCDNFCLADMVICEDDGPTTNCCGDGILQGFEECDDGNDHNGDGCNWECDVMGQLSYETSDGTLIDLHR